MITESIIGPNFLACISRGEHEVIALIGLSVSLITLVLRTLIFLVFPWLKAGSCMTMISQSPFCFARDPKTIMITLMITYLFQRISNSLEIDHEISSLSPLSSSSLWSFSGENEYKRSF